MSRERQGFIVGRVCAVIEYIDASGHYQRITKPISARSHREKRSICLRDRSRWFAELFF